MVQIQCLGPPDVPLTSTCIHHQARHSSLLDFFVRTHFDPCLGQGHEVKKYFNVNFNGMGIERILDLIDEDVKEATEEYDRTGMTQGVFKAYAVSF